MHIVLALKMEVILFFKIYSIMKVPWKALDNIKMFMIQKKFRGKRKLNFYSLKNQDTINLARTGSQIVNK